MRLFEGDCLEIMPYLASASVDAVICDLPYGITRNKWDCEIPLELLWPQYLRISKNLIILTAVQPFASRLINFGIEQFRYELIWEKTEPTGFLNANRMPLRSHENILIFYRELPVYKPQMVDCEPYKVKRNRAKDAGENYGEIVRPDVSYYTQQHPRSVLTFSTDKQKVHLHPTQKPVALMEWLIKTYTKENAVILDNSMGSGSTGVACLNTNRDFIGIEKNPEYFQVANERILQAQFQAAVRTAESMVSA